MSQHNTASIWGRRALGLGYIAVIAGLISLSLAAYHKDFTTYTYVKLEADHTGNQLLTQSDVKIRGKIVGEVKKIDSHGDGATLTLAMKPEDMHLIPVNVSAQFLPKTLFGEKYIALIPPAVPERSMKAGDVINQDHSAVATELSQVLDNLLPLLQAVKPAELSATLNALQQALQGRGKQLGQTLVQLNSYLGEFNPHATELVDTLDKLGKVSNLLTDVAPDLLDTLDNLSVTGQTLVEKRSALDALLANGTDAVNVLTSFLSDNSANLISVSAQSAEVTALLAQYSPEFECFFKGATTVHQRANATIYNKRIHFTIEVVKQRGVYVTSDTYRPVLGIGPQCWGLPTPNVPFKLPAKYANINDGAALVGGPGSGALNVVDRSGLNQMGEGSDAENRLVNVAISGLYNAQPGAIPAIATVLAAPLLRGNEVTLK